MQFEVIKFFKIHQIAFCMMSKALKSSYGKSFWYCIFRKHMMLLLWHKQKKNPLLSSEGSFHYEWKAGIARKITPVCNPDNRKNSALPFSIQHQLTAKTVPHAEVFSYIMPAFFLFCGFLHHIVIKEFPYHIAGSAHMKAAGHNNDVLPCMCIT